MSDNSLRELLPSTERIAIGGSDPRGTNTIERYQSALIRYGKQSFGTYWEVFRDLAIKEILLHLTSPQRLINLLLEMISLLRKIYST